MKYMLSKDNNFPPFVFIGDLLELQDDEPIEIIPTYFLKRADRSQIQIIKDKFEIYNHPKFISSFPGFYDYEIIRRDNGISFGDELSDKNYFVIEYKLDHQASYELQLALLLSDMNLTVLFDTIGVTTFSDFQISFFRNLSSNSYPTKKVTREAIKQIAQIYNFLKSVDVTKFKYLDKALQDFWLLNAINRTTMYRSIRTIIIFSILETLLTHNPENNYDKSVTQQFKNKILLLNKRFETSLPFNEYFEVAKEDTILTKLYAYRSDIAHGDFVDFEKKLKILGNHNTIYDFIFLLLRRVLIQAIKEPELIEDLKWC